MGGVVTSSIGSGRLITRTGRYKIFPLVGTTLMAIGLWLFSTMSTDTSLLTASAFMLIFGTGIGLVLQVLVIAVQNAVEARDLGARDSSATFFRSLGGSFGTALFGAVLTSQLAIRLASLLPQGAEMGELDREHRPDRPAPGRNERGGGRRLRRLDNDGVRPSRPHRPRCTGAGRVPSRAAAA